MKLTRRTFFKVTAVGAATVAGVATRAEAAQPVDGASSARGILVDTTKCIGCRACEAACAEANALDPPDWSDEMSYSAPRRLSDKQWTVVNRYASSGGEVFVKTQCMHCVQPACAAACLTKALERNESGAVVWNGNRCMGCRFCMVACPYDVPKFEYDSWNPRIQKCRLCAERVREGRSPACVENCGGGALTFGKREDLLQLARERIYRTPGEYVPRIYGADDVGGTSWLYISRVPFEKLGFRTDLGTTPIPETTRDFLTAVPLVLIAWPAMLLALRGATAAPEPAEAAGHGEVQPVPPGEEEN